MRLCDALEAKGQLEATQHTQLVSTLLGTLTESETPEELADNWQRVATHLDLLLDRPEAVDALEQTILQLAVRGLLVSQDPQDEPASALLKQIRAEKDRLIAGGKIKRDKPLAEITAEEKPFELPMGWEWVRLGAAAKKITDGTHHSPANYPAGDCMYLSAKNIKPWGVDLSSATYISKDVHDEIFARCDPELGDILYIKDGATTGVLTVNTIREPFSLLSSVGVIKPSCGLTSDFMALVMQSPFFYQAMRDGMSGVAITRVTLSKLGDAKFPLPPLAEQSRIVARVAALRVLCANLRHRVTTARSQQALLAGALVKKFA
jgi:type I restriction enzyme, S subunit